MSTLAAHHAADNIADGDSSAGVAGATMIGGGFDGSVCGRCDRGEYFLRQFDVSTSLFYKWRRQAVAGEAPAAFAPAVVLPEPTAAAPPEMPAIVVELSKGVRLKIGSHASATLVTATSRALR